MVHIPGTAHCTSNGTVRQDQTATLTCTLPFTGSDVDWRVDWDHGDRKLSSVNEDSPGLVRRYVSFPATIHDAGIYQCIISSRIPPVTEKCTTSLAVTREYFRVCIFPHPPPKKKKKNENEKNEKSCTNPAMHHFVTEICTCVHITVIKWCNVGYLSNALWYLWHWFIVLLLKQTPLYNVYNTT